jgi:hypothetical protein
MVGMALLEKTNYQIFHILSVDTGAGTAVLDRTNNGSAISGASYAINPMGTPLYGLKAFPNARHLVEVNYTFAPPKLVQDNDLTLLPTDTPMLAGIDVIVTKWETVGERGFINEVLYQDKKFIQQMEKVLRFRGTGMTQRMYTLQEFQNRRYPRQSNPWNMR